MKLVAMTSAALLAATTAFAGNLTYEAPAEEAVAVEEASTGSGSWIIPLVAIAAIALAVSANEEE